MDSLDHILDRHDLKNVGSSHSLEPGQSEIVANCQGDPSTATVISVVLIRRDEIPTLGPGPLVSWPYATVQFGNGGSLAEFECDMINGIGFSLPASSIRVEVFNPAGSPGKMDLGAFLSYFPLSRNTRLKRSYPVGVIAPVGQTPLIEVPPFAGNVTFERTNEQSFRIDFYDHNENLRYSVPAAFGQTLPPVDISAGVSAIRIFNTSFAQWDRGSIVFGLEI